MGRGPGRPVKTRRQPHGLGRAARMKPTSHGQRPGPALQICQNSRPGPARPVKFRYARPSPAPPITCSILSARPSPTHIKFFKRSTQPGPAHHMFNFFRPDQSGPHQVLQTFGPARPITSSIFSARSGPLHSQNSRPDPARPITISRTARPAPSAHGKPWKTSASHDIAVYWLFVGFTLGNSFHLVPRSGASSFQKLPGLQ